MKLKCRDCGTEKKNAGPLCEICGGRRFVTPSGLIVVVVPAGNPWNPARLEA